MNVQIALTDSEIDDCYPVMSELRPHLERPAFVRIVREMEADGYTLAYLATPAGVVSVAGFRIMRTLFCDRFLYVDDLVTASAERSKGHGRVMLGWLKARARAAGCAQLHLDSAMHRKDAHRFYGANAIETAGYHFRFELEPRVPWKS